MNRANVSTIGTNLHFCCLLLCQSYIWHSEWCFYPKMCNYFMLLCCYSHAPRLCYSPSTKGSKKQTKKNNWLVVKPVATLLAQAQALVIVKNLDHYELQAGNMRVQVRAGACLCVCARVAPLEM